MTPNRTSDSSDRGSLEGEGLNSPSSDSSRHLVSRKTRGNLQTPRSNTTSKKGVEEGSVSSPPASRNPQGEHSDSLSLLSELNSAGPLNPVFAQNKVNKKTLTSRIHPESPESFVVSKDGQRCP